MRNGLKMLAALSVAACVSWALAPTPAQAASVRSTEPITNVKNIEDNEGEGVNFLPLLRQIEQEYGPLAKLVSKGDDATVYPLRLSDQQNGQYLSFDAPNIEYTEPGNYSYTLSWTYIYTSVIAMSSNPVEIIERVTPTADGLDLSRQAAGNLELHLFSDATVSTVDLLKSALYVDAPQKPRRFIELDAQLYNDNEVVNLNKFRTFFNVESYKDIDISEVLQKTDIPYKNLFEFRDRSVQPTVGADYIDVTLAFKVKFTLRGNDYLYETDESSYPILRPVMRIKANSVELLNTDLPQTRLVLTDDLRQATVSNSNTSSADPNTELSLLEKLGLPKLSVGLSGDKTIEANEFRLNVRYIVGTGDLGLQSSNNDAKGDYHLALAKDAMYGWACYELKQSLADPNSKAAQEGSYSLDQASHYLMVLSLPFPFDGAFKGLEVEYDALADSNPHYVYYLYYDSIAELMDSINNMESNRWDFVFKKASKDMYEDAELTNFSYEDYEKLFEFSPILALMKVQSEMLQMQSKSSYSAMAMSTYRDYFFIQLEPFFSTAKNEARFNNSYKLHKSAAASKDESREAEIRPKQTEKKPVLPSTSDMALGSLAISLAACGLSALWLRKRLN